MDSEPRTIWGRLPVIIRAIVGGLVVGLVAANVWPILLLKLGMPVAAILEVIFLAIYAAWAAGAGPPSRLHDVRADYFRWSPLSGGQIFWGIIAAISFAATVHAAIVLLFRFVPFPAAAFHQGYNFSFIPSRQMQRVAVVVSALSAGVCEEIGFRGYMQRPIENRHGAVLAILISSVLFTLIHLTKGWALIGMVPIVFGAGLLLGTLARASGTLAFCIAGHWIMDIGLFGYWWTQMMGTFSQRPISETGIDQAFVVECVVFAVALLIVLTAIVRLTRLKR